MDKLLTYLMQAAEGNKRRIKKLFTNPSDETNALLNRGVENTQAHINKLTGKPYNQGNDQAYQDAMNEAALAALTVYHGSPHKFDKFDMSKIGTGEGAQAYGHGLYFAEAPAVAEGYRKSLTAADRVGYFKPGMAMVDNVPAKELGQDVWEVADILASRNIKIDDYINDLNKKLSATGGNAARKETIKELIEQSQRVRDKLAERNVAWVDPGYTYKVDIPDEAIHRMLDWDKPLSQQAPEVQAALEPAINNAVRKYRDIYGDDRWMTTFAGQQKPFRNEADAINYLKNTIDTRDAYYMFGPQEEATKQLAAKGIPGIRYLDGGSRSAGTGTYNYVLFDDKLPRILERNGVPTGNKPWAPGEANELLINALRKK